MQVSVDMGRLFVDQMVKSLNQTQGVVGAFVPIRGVIDNEEYFLHDESRLV
ncbi:MAG: hypothetical protein LRY61_01635 [Burkholderiaceae bacterium]|nr:hypothetical protein [Burkholderiaceae bacterium]